MAIIRYHVNPSNGMVGPCRAKPGNCRFGENGVEAQHYSSESEARAGYEQQMEASNGTTVTKMKPPVPSPSQMMKKRPKKSPQPQKPEQYGVTSVLINDIEDKRGELIITRGVPASGKSTYAEQWVAEDPGNRVEANRDNIRAMLNFPPMGDADQEGIVTSIHDALVSSSLKAGKSVIISNTNLVSKGVKGYAHLGIEHKMSVEVKDFSVPLHELIKRDAGREKSVGEDVVRLLHGRFKSREPLDSIAEAVKKGPVPKFTPIKQDPSLPKSAVFDMDGTLAHIEDRSPYDYTRVKEDTVNENIADMARYHRERGEKIVIFSGREDSCYEDTVQWLNDNNIPFDELHMRKTGDQRKDSVIKRELIEKHLVGKLFVKQWFDDRQQVVDMVRQTFGEDNPTICVQVNYGDF